MDDVKEVEMGNICDGESVESGTQFKIANIPIFSETGAESIKCAVDDPVGFFSIWSWWSL